MKLFPKNSGRPLLLALSLLGLTAVTGCTFFRLARASRLKVPHFAYVDHALREVTLDDVNLEVTLNAKNPNSIGLRNVELGYELFTEGKSFLSGNGIQVALAPNGETQLRVPMKVVYADLLRVVGPTAQKLLLGRKTIPVTVKAVLHGNPTLYNEIEEGGLFTFTLTVTKDVDVPVPQQPIDNAKSQIRKSIRKMF